MVSAFPYRSGPLTRHWHQGCMVMCVCVCVPPIQNSSWWRQKASCWRWQALLFSSPPPGWLFHSWRMLHPRNPWQHSFSGRERGSRWSLHLNKTEKKNRSFSENLCLTPFQETSWKHQKWHWVKIKPNILETVCCSRSVLDTLFLSSTLTF